MKIFQNILKILNKLNIFKQAVKTRKINKIKTTFKDVLAHFLLLMKGWIIKILKYYF